MANVSICFVSIPPRYSKIKIYYALSISMEGVSIPPRYSKIQFLVYSTYLLDEVSIPPRYSKIPIMGGKMKGIENSFNPS